MPFLERLVSDHQLISYPSAILEGSNRNACRFNDIYEIAISIVVADGRVDEMYVVQMRIGGNLYFSFAEEIEIGQGKRYQLTDIVAVVRKGKR